MDERKALGMLLIAVILVFSYSYVISEVQDIADDDPTHNGKAFVAEFMPWFWMILIIADLGVFLWEISKDIS